MADLTEKSLEDALAQIQRLMIDNAMLAIHPTKMILGPPWLEYCEQRGLDPVKTAQAIIDSHDG